ncbi:MAG: protein BatD [Bdellovibrionales bacterium]|nr:protein BatD [Bdellovibrionales bacterium]
MIWAVADEVTVTANVDRNEMRPGDTFTYSISVTAQGATSFDKPQLPDLSAFDVLSSWSGSEMRGTFVNGQVQTQRSQTFNYMLSAKNDGQFTIGAAEVVVNGQRLRSNPIEINVSSSAPQGAPRAERRQKQQDLFDQIDQAEDDLFSQLLNRRLRPGQRAMEPSSPDEAFFIHVETDKTKVYQGEQVIASWYLVTRAQIADIDTLKYPSLSGFWKEDIEVATRLNFQPVVINGVPYQKALLASYALFPIKAGTALIDSYKAKCRVISQSLIGFPRDAQVVKESEAIKIDVLELPPRGSFSTFSGGVGEFTVSANVDSTTVKANVPVTLKVRIEGRGNAKVVDLPKMTLADSAQIYDTKNEMKFYPNGRSYKEFETLIVPKAAGEFKIPSLGFVFFNPSTKSYYEQSTQEFTIKVDPADGSQVIASTNLESPDVKNVEKKLLLPGILLTSDSSSTFTAAQQIGAWGLLFALTGLGLGGYAYRQVGRREKREDLKRQVRRRISEIETQLNHGEWRKVGVESTNLVYSVLAEIAGLGGASFEFDKIVEKAPPSFKRNMAPQLKILMSKLEVVGFAPEDIVGKWKEKKELSALVSETEKILIAATKYDFNSQENEKARL